MLKISQSKNGRRVVTLQLEGRAVGPWVDELRRTCEPLLADNGKLKLDLAGVSYLDNDGVILLSDLRVRGVLLQNASSFIEAQLEAGVWGKKMETKK